MSWGDNSAARPTTDKYRDNHDRLFGKKAEVKKDEQKDVSPRGTTKTEAKV